MLDVEALKAPIAGGSGVGPELRGEVEFGDIEESPRSFGGMTPAELKKVIKQCGDMLARTKDQALAIIAIEAAARIGDLAEMRAALAVIEHMIADHWDDYHPGPADEMADARINELAALKRKAALSLPLSRTHFAKLPGPGDVGFTIGMIRTASAPVAAWTKDDEARLKEQVDKGGTTSIDADVQRQQRERGRVLRQIVRTVCSTARVVDSEAEISYDEIPDVGEAENAARAILAQVTAAIAPLSDFADALMTVDENMGSRAGSSPGLGQVAQEFYAMSKSCEAFVEAFSDPPPVVTLVEEGVEGITGGVAVAGGAAPARPVSLSLDSVRSRADVITAMDAIIRYYGESEPTSPVPLMIRRVRSWVNKDFFELIKDIAPAQSDELSKLLGSSE